MSLLTKPVKEIEWEDLEEFFGTTQHEGIYLEFKGMINDNLMLARSIAAFANTHGGWLFIGINEKEDKVSKTSIAKHPLNWKGIDYRSDFEHWVNSIVRSYIYPFILIEAVSIKIKSNPKKMIGIIRVYESDTAPHFTQNESEKKGSDLYIRRLDSKDPNVADREMVEILMKKRKFMDNKREFFINRSKKRAYHHGIKMYHDEAFEHRNLYDPKYNDKHPLVFSTCLPKYPDQEYYNYANLHNFINHPIGFLTDSIHILPQLLHMPSWGTQTDSVFHCDSSERDIFIEYTKFAQCSATINPRIKKGLISTSYCIYALLYPFLHTIKYFEFPVPFVHVIHLEYFNKHDFKLEKRSLPGFEIKLENVEARCIIEIEFTPILKSLEQLEYVKILSDEFCRAINFNWREELPKIQQEFTNYHSSAKLVDNNET